ncbi:hypothetical protein [Pyrococcus kukulkanii]|uniref:Uncharacterized protein n=1 Tax=Pyrococcus kukulkanii TaxID=1609559 RepID=A0ABV4T5W9_9EURY
MAKKYLVIYRGGVNMVGAASDILRIYIGDSKALELIENEYFEFHYDEVPTSEEKFRKDIEWVLNRGAPLEWAGEVEDKDGKIKELIETYREIKRLEEKMRELYRDICEELQLKAMERS